MKKTLILMVVLSSFILVACSNADRERQKDFTDRINELSSALDGKPLTEKEETSDTGATDAENSELSGSQRDADGNNKPKMLTLSYQPEGISPTEQQRSDLVKIMQKRLDAFLESAIIKDATSHIKIRIPDTEEARESLQRLLFIGDFRIVDEAGNTGITSEHVKEAIANDTDYTGMINYSVEITFTEDGALRFKEVTEQNINKMLDFYLDDQLLLSALVAQEITDGRCVLSAMSSREEAEYLAVILRYGSLPFRLSLVE